MANVNSPVEYPLGPPTLSGTLITVDEALNSPGYITQRLSDISLQNFLVSFIFKSSGLPVNGGAILYDQILTNQLYTDQDVEQVAPGANFPTVTVSRAVPSVATVSKYGGKFRVTDEARRRNDVRLLENAVQQLSNTLVKKVNTLAVAALDTAIASLSGATTFTGANSGTGGWGGVIVGGSSQTPNNKWPHADFAHAQLLADQAELGVTFDRWLLNPAEASSLRIIYGAELDLVLASFGIKIVASNRVTAGTAYVVDTQQVGFLEYEQGLNTETWREQEIESTWVQSSVRPVMGVTNPYSVVKVTGLGS